MCEKKYFGTGHKHDFRHFITLVYLTRQEKRLAFTKWQNPFM